MAKQKKKRNKTYTGAGAKVTHASITHVSAVNRNKPAQWWHDNKRVAKPVLITAVVALLVVWLIVELVRTVIGA